MRLLDNKRIYCLGAVEELHEQTHRKLTQQCLAHSKDSDNVSCYYHAAGAHSPEVLGGLVLPTAFTPLRACSLLQIEADVTGSI